MSTAEKVPECEVCRWHIDSRCVLTMGCRFELKAPPPALTRAKDAQVAGTHYKEMGVEPWDVVDTWPLEQKIGAYRHGALKYIMRMGTKDASAQEIAKAKHYLEKLLEVLNQETKNG